MTCWGLFYTPTLLPNNGHIGECFSQECVHLQVKENLTNVSLNEQNCLVSPGNLEADLFRACVSRILLVGLFLMVIASRWIGCLCTLALIPGFQREGGGRETGGPSIIIHLLQQESTALARSSTQQTGSHFKGQIWVTWLPQLQGWMGRLRLEFSSLHRRGREQLLG